MRPGSVIVDLAAERRHGEFDGGPHMEDRGEMRRRIEWTPAIPQGAERL
jgi:hypothetical protein